jgi:formate dehydrogenase major subunit
MRTTIGEGAATNPFDDIYETEFMIVMGSNTTEGHPIVANRMLDVIKDKGIELAVLDVRRIQLSKSATHHLSIPYEANLMMLNMMAYVIISEDLVNVQFIESRTKGYEEYKQAILEDPYANPDYLHQIPGYESLAQEIRTVAQISTRKSLFFWGLGITEHLDGSYAVMAITHLALITGNIGKRGAGLMPLRGQNNVQGTCDVGMLPYYAPDYQPPKEIGMMSLI